jgi:hypothetical protein
VTSIFEKEGKSFVWVIDEKTMTVQLREVETLELTNFGVKIKGDLKTGDWIATKGVHYLEEGQKVRLLKNGDNMQNSKEESS